MSALAKKIATSGPVVLKNTIAVTRPKLATFLKYAKVELTPPGPADVPKIQEGIQNLIHSAKTGKWKQVSVREAWLNTLIVTEIAMWFFVGECIGKGSVIGYRV
ncbi:ATP synthase subunit g, mitochondrial-like [Artemia franciscana]|uniref:ATP synthase subunit g n=1 Tax=Artemia franciscana TaxID=6661 RepID=A0AA88HPA7_ARTSF|nr:hypothetical protein QYM36_013082 [Artemia franciscana]KAK2709293.1 hypothetical protein QYM36_013082 [Artemia franciscana]